MLDFDEYTYDDYFADEADGIQTDYCAICGVELTATTEGWLCPDCAAEDDDDEHR